MYQDHDVPVLDGTVLLDPPVEPIVAGALVGVGAASVPLGGLVWGNPEMLAGETTALAHLGVLLSERENVGLRNQLVRLLALVELLEHDGRLHIPSIRSQDSTMPSPSDTTAS